MIMSRPLPENGVITKPGHYHLEAHFISSKPTAITIDSSDVTLNLNGKMVRTLVTSGLTIGIHVATVKNVKIFEGIISGTTIGIQAPYCDELHLSALDVFNTLEMGINFGGIDSTISHCSIAHIGGSHDSAYAVAINSAGAIRASISRNLIMDIYRQKVPVEKVGEGVGVLLGHDTKECMVNFNTIINDDYEDHTYGIWAVGNKHLISFNNLCNNQYGVYMGDSQLDHNVIILKEFHQASYAISGGSGSCEANTIINYAAHYNNKFQEDVTAREPLRVIE